MSCAIAMSVRSSSGKIHNTVNYPEDLDATFSSDAVITDIAGNFPGVEIIKDTVSPLLHVFGPDNATVGKAVIALNTFISEACFQKIYADAFADPSASVSFFSPVTSNSSGAAVSSVLDDELNEPVGLEVVLNGVAPDITKVEVLSTFQWTEAEVIECPIDETTTFLTGTVYMKFKNRRDCAKARENITAFYSNYTCSQLSRASIDSVLADLKKKEHKKNNFFVLDEYLQLHESEEDSSDRDQLKRDAMARRNVLHGELNSQKREQSSEGAASSRRGISPPNTQDNTLPYATSTSKKQQIEPSSRGHANRHPSSSTRPPYFQNQNSNAAVAIPPAPSRPWSNLRPVAIDANNVCMAHGTHQVYSCRGLELAINYFLERGHTEVFGFVPEMKIRGQPMNQNPRIDRQEILHKLESDGNLVVVPHKKLAAGQRVNPYDDVLIVKYAFEKKGVIISNDNMIDVGRDHPQYKDYIDKWRITFCFAGDHFMIIDDPNGRSRGAQRAEEMLQMRK